MRKILLFAFMLGVSTFVQAQDDNEPIVKLRHVKGSIGIDASVAYAHYGTAYQLGYIQYFNEKHSLSIMANYERGIIRDVDKNATTSGNNEKYLNSIAPHYEDLLANVLYGYTVYAIKDKVFFNLKAGGLVGMSKFVNPKTEIISANFNYGVVAGAEAEIYLVNRLAVIAYFNEQYTFKNIFGKIHYQLGGGLRFFVK